MMKRILAAVSALVLCFSLSSCGQPENNGGSAEKAKAAQGEETVPGMLARLIRENHPSPFTVLSESDFEEKIARLEADWDALSSRDDAVYYALQELVSSLGDEHTSLAPPPDLSQPELPFFALPYDGRWVIVQAVNGYEELVGKELTAVNGVGMEELCERLLTLISHNTREWAVSQCAGELRYFRNLRHIGVTDDLETAAVTVKDAAAGQEQTVECAALTGGYDYENRTFYSNIARTLAQSGYYRADLLEDGTPFIQYNVCAEDGQMTMEDFAGALEEKVLSQEQDKIIVDLRNNSGGDSSVIGPLLDTLKKYEKKGAKIYCLIGSGTFSSGTMNAVDLKNMGAVLVGGPAGGILGFGEPKAFELPDGSVLYCSTKDFSGYGGYEGQLMPDITAVQTVEDFLAGRDTAVELVRTLE